MPRRRGEQLPLFRRGGRRPGAGRKPKGARAGTPHRETQSVNRHTPVHVTLRMREGLPSLRTRDGHRAFMKAMADARERLGMRVTHWSLQRNHVHLIAEARSAGALSKAMTGLSVRFVRAWNRAVGRKGRALGDRYHARVLRKPLEVRNAILYVLANARHHTSGPARGRRWLDALSSAAWFDGWADGRALAAAIRGALAPEELAAGPPVAGPCSWLLTTGWKRHGRLSTSEVPAG